MSMVTAPKPTFAQKLKRFFMIDLLKGLGLTLKYNLGAIIDKDAVAGKGIYTEQYPKVRPDVGRPDVAGLSTLRRVVDGQVGNPDAA